MNRDKVVEILERFGSNDGADYTWKDWLEKHVDEILASQWISDTPEEEYQRLLYWVLMEKQGQKVPWSGKFIYNHEKGLAWFERWTHEQWEKYLQSKPLPAPPEA